MLREPPQTHVSHNGPTLTASPAAPERHRSHQMSANTHATHSKTNLSGPVAASTSTYEQQMPALQLASPYLKCPHKFKPQIRPSATDCGPHVARGESSSQIPNEKGKRKYGKEGNGVSQRAHSNKMMIRTERLQYEFQGIVNRQHRDPDQNIQNTRHPSAAPEIKYQQAPIESLALPINANSQQVLEARASMTGEPPKSTVTSFDDRD